jgi:hypothetical protein
MGLKKTISFAVRMCGEIGWALVNYELCSFAFSNHLGTRYYLDFILN